MALSTSLSVVTRSGLSSHHDYLLKDVLSVGVATFSNFKTGSSNLHSAGVEVAGVTINNSGTIRAGGGGGAARTSPGPGAAGTGGTGGGGNGNSGPGPSTGYPGGNATVNTGGGGGGSAGSSTGGSGGSGIVIIRYKYQ